MQGATIHKFPETQDRSRRFGGVYQMFTLLPTLIVRGTTGGPIADVVAGGEQP